jgi:hypothetical protein
MRAFHSNHKHIRVSSLVRRKDGTFGGYDLKRKEWMQMDGGVHDTLQEARIAAEKKVTALCGKQPSEMIWH